MKIEIRLCPVYLRPFAPNIHNQKYCKRKDCHPEEHNLLKSENRRIKCICPMCGCIHIRFLNWTGGNFLPRIRCAYCNTKINALYNNEGIDQETQELINLLEI